MLIADMKHECQAAEQRQLLLDMVRNMTMEERETFWMGARFAFQESQNPLLVPASDDD